MQFAALFIAAKVFDKPFRQKSDFIAEFYQGSHAAGRKQGPPLCSVLAKAHEHIGRKKGPPDLFDPTGMPARARDHRAISFKGLPFDVGYRNGLLICLGIRAIH